MDFLGITETENKHVVDGHVLVSNLSDSFGLAAGRNRYPEHAQTSAPPTQWKPLGATKRRPTARCCCDAPVHPALTQRSPSLGEHPSKYIVLSTRSSEDRTEVHFHFHCSQTWLGLTVYNFVEEDDVPMGGEIFAKSTN